MDLAFDQRVSGSRWSLANGLGLGLRPVHSIGTDQARLSARMCGRIVIEDRRVEAVYGRWWPYSASLLRVWMDKRWRSFPSDRCELYYHAPWTTSKFLTLDYVRSGPRTSLSTFYAATLVLDEIARLRQSNAIVCNVTNTRISDRLMHRWGWEEHCQNWSGRHFIKRLYGTYPVIPAVWRERLGLGPQVVKPSYVVIKSAPGDRSDSAQPVTETEHSVV